MAAKLSRSRSVWKPIEVVGEHRLGQFAVLRQLRDGAPPGPGRVQEEADLLADAEPAQFPPQRQEMIIVDPEGGIRRGETRPVCAPCRHSLRNRRHNPRRGHGRDRRANAGAATGRNWRSPRRSRHNAVRAGRRGRWCRGRSFLPRPAGRHRARFCADFRWSRTRPRRIFLPPAAMRPRGPRPWVHRALSRATRLDTTMSMAVEPYSPNCVVWLKSRTMPFHRRGGTLP